MCQKVFRAFALLLIFMCASVSWASAVAIPKSCELSLGSSKHIQNLRAEILKASLRISDQEREGAKISNQIQGRARDIDTQSLVGQHVISLGSGPDVLLPLYLYPDAKHFHLVDILRGWGRGPLDIFAEIESRLSELAPDVLVERLDQLGDWREVALPLTQPMVWSVKWISPSEGLQDKIFLLHQGDFNDLGFLRKIVAQAEVVQPIGLSGILFTGITPHYETLEFLMSRLYPEGFMFGEFFQSMNDSINLIKLDQKYDVFDLGLSEMNTKFVPHVHVIRPERKAKPDQLVVEGKPLDKDTLRPGMIVKLKAELKQIVLGNGGGIGSGPTETVPIYNTFEVGRGGKRVPPGTEIHILSKVKKTEGIAHVEVEVPIAKFKGKMYWWDLYTNGLDITPEGKIEPAPTKKSKVKFPAKKDSRSEEELNKLGLSAYGRPFAKVGDKIWTQNVKGQMSLQTVGIVTEIDEVGVHGHVMAKYTTLNGRRQSQQLSVCVVLTDEEFEIARTQLGAE